MKWISVEDELPAQLFADYLVYPQPRHVYGDKFTAEYRGGGEWVTNCEDSYHCYDANNGNVTHWMPIPEPPSDAL